MYTYSNIFYKCRVNDEITELTSDQSVWPQNCTINTDKKKEAWRWVYCTAKMPCTIKKWFAIFLSPAGMSPTLFYSVGEFCKSHWETKNVVIFSTLFLQSSSHRHKDADKAKWTFEQSCSVVCHKILSYFLGRYNYNWRLCNVSFAPECWSWNSWFRGQDDGVPCWMKYAGKAAGILGGLGRSS
jgi:hypothetical protein